MDEDYLKSNKPTLQEWIESQPNMETLVNPNFTSQSNQCKNKDANYEKRCYYFYDDQMHVSTLPLTRENIFLSFWLSYENYHACAFN